MNGLITVTSQNTNLNGGILSHSLLRIWIHGVFGTKNCKPIIEDHFRVILCNHIHKHLSEIGCFPRIVSGTEDHLHCLFRLSYDMTVSRVFKDIKGESSHFVNFNDFLIDKFSWQIGYGAFSVSKPHVNIVESYISNQVKIHQSISFSDEYNRLIRTSPTI